MNIPRSAGRSPWTPTAPRARCSRGVGWDVVFGSDFPFVPELAAPLSVVRLEPDERFDGGALDGIRRSNALRLLEDER
jgi:hypothetical protein